MTCNHIDTVNHDWQQHDGTLRVNRVCLTCRQHWHSDSAGIVTEYTAKQWDAWVSVAEQYWLQQRTIERMRLGVEGTHTV